MVLANAFFIVQFHTMSCGSASGFDELLTPAEKSKLYTAIGYSETAANPNLPKDVSHLPPDTHLSTNNTLAFVFPPQLNNITMVEI